MRRLKIYLAGTILVTVLALGATLISGNEPILGLDLQGGVSVVLQPVGKNVKSGSIDQAVDIIRNRVDSLGVAEPDISRQGDNIVVDLPGVKDRAKAQRIVGRTAELRFRSGASPTLPAGSEEARRVEHDDDHSRLVHDHGAGFDHEQHDHDHDRPRGNDAAAQAAIASCDVNQLAALPHDPHHRSSPTTSATRASSCRSARVKERGGCTSARRS